MRWPLPLLALAGLAAGCRGEFEIPPQPRNSQPIILQPGQVVDEPNGEEVEAAPAKPMCQARARFFRGAVTLPCEDIARMVAP